MVDEKEIIAEEKIEKVLEQQQQRQEEREKKKISRLALLEAVLFTTHEALSVKNIAKILKTTELQVEKLLREIKEKYEKEDSGIMLSDTGGYKLVVKTQFLITCCITMVLTVF